MRVAKLEEATNAAESMDSDMRGVRLGGGREPCGADRGVFDSTEFELDREGNVHRLCPTRGTGHSHGHVRHVVVCRRRRAIHPGECDEGNRFGSCCDRNVRSSACGWGLGESQQLRCRDVSARGRRQQTDTSRWTQSDDQRHTRIGGREQLRDRTEPRRRNQHGIFVERKCAEAEGGHRDDGFLDLFVRTNRHCRGNPDDGAGDAAGSPIVFFFEQMAPALRSAN
jgi:hypothetical protein